MEKRALLAVVISILILILYQEWVARRYGTPPPPPPEKASEKAAAPSPPSPRPRPKAEEIKALGAGGQPAAREIRVETDRYVAVFTNQGARLKSFTLKNYRASVAEKSPPFEMVSAAPGVPYPLGVELSGPKPFTDQDLIYAVEGKDLKLTGNARGTLVFRGQTPTGGVVVKRFIFTGAAYPIEVELTAQNSDRASPPAVVVTSTGNLHGTADDAKFEGLLALVNNKIRRESVDEIKKAIELRGPVSWAGFGYTYFLFSLLPQGEREYQLTAREAGPALIMQMRGLAAGDEPGTDRFTLFIGPKDLQILKSLDKGLERSIDFGYFAFVAIPLLYVMHFSHRFTGSYGIDIILLTILIKILLAPLTHKSFVSMKQMQKLQPQMERLKERFKDDREKLNKETMELYRRNKVNPLGGCLPMLVQFPVFIGLYNALLTPIELRHASFLWIKDLSRPDWESLPFTLGGWTLGIPVLTLLMGASMFLQQWMTPSAGDPNQRRMMLMMPVIFTVMFVTFPAGLTIYWLVNNILTIGQQYLINRMDR
ncbi:MAG: membrane protein insertase YidC [Deltaproteobacteria bacterium]|nr:membrane protein insertase YidC [Deltaproteobacteria bacterium]